MQSLLIETSTEQSGIAIVKNGEVVLQRLFLTGLSSSRSLMPELVASFTETTWTPQDLDFIGVGVGPGSYTGMRVGAMVAKALGFALQCPLVAFTSLEAFCLEGTHEPYAVLFDAKVAGAYVQLFEGGKPEVVALKDLEGYLEGVNVLVSPHREKLLGRLPTGGFKQKQWKEAVLNFGGLAQKCEASFQAGRGCEVGELELLYLRQTQAETELRRNQSHL